MSERLGADPAVVVTSDHGESLFEEGFLGHGYALNDAQSRIPLIVTGLPLVAGSPWDRLTSETVFGRPSRSVTPIRACRG